MSRRKITLADPDGNTVTVKGRNADRVIVLQLAAKVAGMSFDEMLTGVNELLAADNAR